MFNVIYKLYVKMFARKLFSKFNMFLYNLSIRGLGVYNYQNMLISGEKKLIDIIIKKIKTPDGSLVVFDIGANKGEYTNMLLNEINYVQIFSFEPHPKTFKQLSINCQNDKVKLFNCALSSKEGTINLYDYENNDGSVHASLSSEIFTTIHKSTTVSHTVKVLTVDKVCKENNISRIDFLKIDVEGFELEVLRGSLGMISNACVNIIQFEFTQLNTTTRIYFKDFWELLNSNFKIYRLLPNDLLEIEKYDPTINEIFGYQNFVAIRKEM